MADDDLVLSSDQPVTRPKMSRGERDKKRTARRRAFLERGIHPANGYELRVTPEGGQPRTCGDCWHAISIDGRRGRNWWKCELGKLSSSEASDIRLTWPACTAYTSKDDGKSVSPSWVSRASER